MNGSIQGEGPPSKKAKLDAGGNSQNSNSLLGMNGAGNSMGQMGVGQSDLSQLNSMALGMGQGGNPFGNQQLNMQMLGLGSMGSSLGGLQAINNAASQMNGSSLGGLQAINNAATAGSSLSGLQGMNNAAGAPGSGLGGLQAFSNTGAPGSALGGLQAMNNPAGTGSNFNESLGGSMSNAPGGNSMSGNFGDAQNQQQQQSFQQGQNGGYGNAAALSAAMSAAGYPMFGMGNQ